MRSSRATSAQGAQQISADLAAAGLSGRGLVLDVTREDSVSAALAYGPRVRQPKPGDLVVINTRAGYAQHVGFFAGWDHGRMVMVSGNWGHRVAVSPISPAAVAAFIGV